MWYFWLTFVLGALVGSFVNVLIDRTIVGENWVSGRSHCDHCNKTLAWYDMIPIVSYLAYFGRSRCCHYQLSYRYPIVEIIVGLLFGWWLVVGFWFFKLVNTPLSVIQPGFWLVMGIVLLILALADLFYGVVLMGVVYMGSVTVILYRLILWWYGAYNGSDFVLSLIVAGVFYLAFWSLYKLTNGRGMADGDMYVALYTGLLLGWPRGMIAIIGSFILGAVCGLFLIMTKLKTRRDTIPFVPFMILAIVMTLVWGEQIIGYVS